MIMDKVELTRIARSGRLTAQDVDAEAECYERTAGRTPEAESGKKLAMQQAASKLRRAAILIREAARVPSTLAGLTEEMP